MYFLWAHRIVQVVVFGEQSFEQTRFSARPLSVVLLLRTMRQTGAWLFDHRLVRARSQPHVHAGGHAVGVELDFVRGRDVVLSDAEAEALNW